MFPPDHVLLKQEHFTSNLTRILNEQRELSNISDITLACEDSKTITAHKAILAAASPFFRDILANNMQLYSLVYMSKIKIEVLSAIVDFIYFGEVNILQKDLEIFLACGVELQLNGMLEKEGDLVIDRKILTANKEQSMKNHSFSEKLPTILYNEKCSEQTSENIDAKYEEKIKDEDKHANHKTIEEDSKFMEDNNIIDQESKFSKTFAFPLSGKLPVYWNIDPSGSSYVCQVCGHKSRQKDSAHIETHREGMVYHCSQCGKEYTTKGGLRMHLRKNHDNLLHSCMECGKENQSTQELRFHTRRVHNKWTQNGFPG